MSRAVDGNPVSFLKANVHQPFRVLAVDVNQHTCAANTTMKNVVHKLVGETCISAYSADAPSKEEWRAYIDGIRQDASQHGTEWSTLSHLLFVDGGGPEILPPVPQEPTGGPIAIVTPLDEVRSVLACGVGLVPQVGIFAPDELDQALEHLGVPSSQLRQVVSAIELLPMHAERPFVSIAMAMKRWRERSGDDGRRRVSSSTAPPPA